MKLKRFIAQSLLLTFGLHVVVGSEGNNAVFKVRINEKGTRFNEKIKINERENTVSFAVPEHNDVERSEVLNEFNLNLTITRLPIKGVCYLKPLDKNLPNPRQMKSDMNFVKYRQNEITKTETLVRSRKWAIDKHVKAKDLHPTILKFCAGYRTYLLKEITEDNWEIERGHGSSNDTKSRNKRQTRINQGLPMCTTGFPSCPPPQWKYYCKIQTRTCVYWAQCKLDNIILSLSSTPSCGFRHDYSSLICCEFRCSAGK